MAKKFPIPELVLQDHMAILGKTGSGKTSTEKLVVEHVVEEDYRVCILDPIKSDWWGITSSADGKKPGLPFTILGGPHGHLPLNSSAGKVMGQLVGSGKLKHSIIDMADFEAGGLQKFFVDFAQSLMRNMKGIVYLVIEEAHEFAPKERAGFSAENMAVHLAKKLATAGRTKGIRMIVATQRVQALHNAVLGSCETMIAMRLNAPADQEPIFKWLKANGTKEQQVAVVESLSSLETGTGWVCSGLAKMFEVVEFPKFKTYDNTATPTKDGKSQDVEVKTAAVDMDQLRTILGAAAEEAAANDPKILRDQIVQLKSEIRKIQAVQPIAATAAQLNETRAEGYRNGETEGFQWGWKECQKAAIETLKVITPGGQLVTFMPSVVNTGEGKIPQKESVSTGLRKVAPQANQMRVGTAGPAAARVIVEDRQGNSHTSLKSTLQRVVNAVAWWNKIGFDPAKRERACVVAGYSPKASTFGVYVAELVKMGMIEVTPGYLSLTDSGRALAVVPFGTDADSLKGVAMDLLEPQEQRVFDVVHSAYPESIARSEVAEKVGLSPTASTIGVYLAGFTAFGLIEVAGRGEVKAADWLFP